MALQGIQTELTSWTRSARSLCVVYQVRDSAGIANALAEAQEQRLTVIPHGAGHSYTDAALNTGGVVIDVTAMHRILSWDPAQGIMCVEPGASLRDVIENAWKDGWWPLVAPSTPDVTIGGCAAMNVNGRNAWKCGPFGASIRAMDVLLATGEVLRLAPERDPQLFQAFVGSLGLLGIITSITLQLQRVATGYVTVRRRSVSSFDEIFSRFAEEERSDYKEAWLDGFARGDRLGRGIVTCAAIGASGEKAPSMNRLAGKTGGWELSLVRAAASLARPLLQTGAPIANRANYSWSRKGDPGKSRVRPLFSYTFWPAAIFAGYHAMLPEGAETFQAFVPAPQAKEVFTRVMRFSQEQGCMPLWCIIKQHRRDPFLLSYQVDGFSLELNYQRTRQTAQKLKETLLPMIAAVIEAGGRFYLAKDHFLTADQYRQSMGDEAVAAFLALKQRYDPETRLQSDLYRRIFQPLQS